MIFPNNLCVKSIGLACLHACCFAQLSFRLNFQMILIQFIYTFSVPIPGWGFNTSRTVSDYVFPDRDTTLIEPRSVCHSNFFVLIVVCSAVDNFSNR